MIDLYYWPTPNGHKITLFLEETGMMLYGISVSSRKRVILWPLGVGQ